MKNYSRLSALVNRLFFFALSLLFLFCRNQKRPYIVASLRKTTEEGDTFYAKEVYIYKENGFALIPKAEISDTPLPITDFSYHWYLYSDQKKFITERRYKMVITHDEGTATGEIFFPGNFLIIKPEEDFILNKDSDLPIIWQRAKNAKTYLLSIYLAYSYIDRSGNNRSFRLSQDTLVSDTFLLYPKEVLFPKDLRQINWGEGRVEIGAIDGSIVWPGAKENIKGMGHGFYYGLNSSGERYFRITQSEKRRK